MTDLTRPIIHSASADGTPSRLAMARGESGRVRITYGAGRGMAETYIGPASLGNCAGG